MQEEERLTEAEWWETFSDFATRQWELTPTLNRIVRSAYLAEMRAYLFKPGGRLLEIGCGSAWAGIDVARHGMSLTGVDTSERQVAKARILARRAGLADARFVVGTVSTLVSQVQHDSILIHAVLHHLGEDDICTLLTEAQERLADGGHIYIYEPLTADRPSVLLRVLAFLVFLCVWSPWCLLHELGIRLRIGPPAFRDAVRQGWTGLSPNERPLDRDWLLSRLKILGMEGDVRYWHAYSLAFAMGCSELRSPLSLLAQLIARGLYWLDQRLLQTPLRDYILGVWTFAAVRVTLREGSSSLRTDSDGN